MTWAETNDRFQRIMDNIEYLHGVTVPFTYECAKALEPVARHYAEAVKEAKQEVAGAWSAAWEQAGHPAPVPTLRATPGTFLDGITGPAEVKA